MWTWFKQLVGGQKQEGEKIDRETKETKFPGVVVGRVLSVEKHPNADRLKLAVIDIGSSKLDIVCGGPNLAVEQLVPVALVGTTLPNGAEIKPAEIRGVKSYGMICAEDELGLSNKHETIMVLSDQAIIGGAIDNFIINN